MAILGSGIRLGDDVRTSGDARAGAGIRASENGAAPGSRGLRVGGGIRTDEIARGCLRLTSSALGGGHAPTDDDLGEFGAAAAQWARDGIPLDTVLETIHDGFRMGWSRIAADVPVDIDEGGHLVIGLLSSITRAASAAYVRELELAASEHHTSSYTAAAALLSGRATAAPARHHGIEIASDYLVAALRLSPHPDESRHDLQPETAARRTARRVRAELAACCGPEALSLLDSTGGTILVPGRPDDETVDRLVGRLSGAAEVPVTAAVGHAARDDVRDMADRVHELLDLAEHLGRGPGVYRMSDLVYEYQLMRPGDGRRQLAQLLSPLDKSPDLIRTLEVHISHDLNRQRTARQLHVHANTVDYRLKRIAELTGFDPTRASGLRPLQAALIARTLDAVG
ncbi:PucR family transcriptional regulator [Rhodococcus rhodnii]|uniref:Transcriptional regulator n=2 Tax=Rhodococcus rhodnii TaxID=38312 RepID=R7WHU6_9NOCA|nr:helix-turn-helix domain-containing protein [Rhodococcus rhodnii]EOM74775.1 hypothetical protein Rrhod_3938 [Rhodococcus rhodnii LMG 5362]TXG89869.1 PucR family transcriptional regulator [Rhodococcus rhodnii]